MKKLLGPIEIAQGKSFPKDKKMKCCAKLRGLMDYHNARLQGFLEFH